MAKEVIDGKQVEVKSKSRNPKIEFDTLQMYFGQDYVVDLESAEGSIVLHQPSLGDIIELGESKFYGSLNPIVTNTTSYRSLLWDLGVDWNEISDFELFKTLYKSIDSEVSMLLFNGFNITNCQLMNKLIDENEQVVLYDEQTNTEINEEVYFYISQFFRYCFQIFPEEKFTKDKMLKKLYIQKDKAQAKRQAEKGENSNSIQSVISACVNHPGFKYKLTELKEIKIYEFYDSVKRLQIYESSTALMKGMYSGFVDTKHIDQESYNFMRNI